MARIHFELTAEQAKAVQGFLKIIEAQDKTTAKMREMNREGQKVHKGMGDIGTITDSAAKSITNWVAGFASVSGVVSIIKGMINELERAVGLRTEMLGTAESLDKMILQIAALPGRGDFTEKGMEGIRKQVEEVAKAGSISMETAAKTLFMSESAMGAATERAMSTAKGIAMVAGPQALMPEEVEMLPKLLDIARAETTEDQMRVFNQVVEAAGVSIAKTGEFIRAFIPTAVSDIERGLTFSQSLAKMVAMVQTTGSVEEAATMARTAVDIAAGRTQQALEYYAEEGKKRGVDYSKLTEPKRVEFVRGLYHEMEMQGPEAFDVLKIKVGGRGFQALRAYFSRSAERKELEALPAIERAETTDKVQRDAEQFRKTMLARSVEQETRIKIAEARTGREFEASTIFQKEIEAIHKQARAHVKGIGEILQLTLTGEEKEKERTGRMLIQENLALAIERARGTPEEEGLVSLMDELQRTISLKAAPEFIQKVFDATKQFGLITEEKRLARPEILEEYFKKSGWPMRRPEIYKRGIESFYNLEGPQPAAYLYPNEENKQTENITEKISKAAEKFDRAADKIGKAADMMSTKVQVPKVDLYHGQVD